MPVSFRRRNKSFNENQNRDENDKFLQLMPGEAKGSSFQLRPKNNTGSSSRFQSSSRIASTSGIQSTSGMQSLIASSSAINSSSLFQSSSAIGSETSQNPTFYINSTQNASIGTSRCSLNGISSLMSEDGTINGSIHNSSIYSNNETVGSSQPYRTTLNRSQSSLTQCFKRQFTRGTSHSAETNARKNEALRLQKNRDESNKRDQAKNEVKSGGKPVKRTKSFTFNTFSLEQFKPKKRNVVGRSQSTKLSGSKSFKLKSNDEQTDFISSRCGNLGSSDIRNFSNLRSCGNLGGSRGKLGSLGKLTSAKLGSSGNLEVEAQSSSQFPKTCRPRFDRDSKARRNLSSNGLPPVYRHVVAENDVLNQTANTDLTSDLAYPR